MLSYFLKNRSDGVPRFSFGLEENLFREVDKTDSIPVNTPIWKRYNHTEYWTSECKLQSEEYCGPYIPQKRIDS
jgi:hypothetical protein